MKIHEILWNVNLYPSSKLNLNLLSLQHAVLLHSKVQALQLLINYFLANFEICSTRSKIKVYKKPMIPYQTKKDFFDYKKKTEL
jgi:glutamate synthase domain-containing protein 1